MMNPSYVTDLAELLHGICHVPAGLNTQIFGIQLDSRKVKKGDLFIALAGSDKSSKAYIQDALDRGANAIVAEGTCCQNRVHEDQGAVELFIDDLKQWVGAIADRFFKYPSQRIKVVGVTGTNGKTSVSNYLADVLALSGMTSGVIGTLGYGLVGETLTVTNYTTPDPVEVHRCLATLRDRGAQCVVMEVSSHGLEQGRVDGVRFEGAVFTNLSRDHLDYHGSMENYARAKQKLFERSELKFAVLNADDVTSSSYKDALQDGVALITYAVEKEADVAVEVASFVAGIEARVSSPLGGIDVRSELLGPFNLSNLLAVIGAGLGLGLSLADLKKVNELKAVPGRMEMLRQGGKPIVVVDYAHTPDALANALSALKHHCKGALIVVFGCGGDRDIGKRAEMAAAAESNADKVYVTDDNPRSESPEKIVADILAGFTGATPVEVIHERGKAIQRSIEESEEEDLVLIAGKGHEDYQEIKGVRHSFDDVLVAKKVLGIVSEEAACD